MEETTRKTENIGHYLSIYLPITEVWIYNMLTSLQNYRPLVLTRTIINENIFLFERIVSLSRINRLRYLCNYVTFKAIGYFPLFYIKCKSENVRLIHAHFGYNGIKILGLKKRLNVPMVCSFYGNDVYLWTAREKYCERLKHLFQSSEQMLVLGPYMKQRLIELGCPEEKIRIHHLGVPVAEMDYRPRELNNQPFRFLIASSFMEKKGIEIAIRALDIVKNQVDFTVDIIGDGPLKKDLLALTNDLKLEEKIRYHGYQNYSSFLKIGMHSHVFLQASRIAKNGDKEGTPMSLVDAMATGLPVVSTHHSDIPEIVIDGVTGFLAQEDDPLDFAQCILKILDNADRFNAMSINSRKHILANFNIRVQTERIEGLYRNMIAEYN